MLYFWPYIVFFSLPLALKPALSPVVKRLPKRPQALCQKYLIGEYSTSAPGLASTTTMILCGLAAVHFNTIVHPYTLADNRHYVFYVFRILLRHTAIRYLAVPFYIICALLTIRTLESPTANRAQVKQTMQDKQQVKSETRQQPCKVSFVAVWAITTTLSVATAPLVEPRYFIVPWIMWRLHVPYLSDSRSQEPRSKSPYDARLVLETAWLLTIDIAIGYYFLYRGFAWPSEPGNVQRFLW